MSCSFLIKAYIDYAADRVKTLLGNFPTSPEGVFQRQQHVARQLGRTTQMIKGVPEWDAYAIVVLRHDYGKEIVRAIAEQRSDIIASRAKIIVWDPKSGKTPYDIDQLRGIRMPVYFEHTVLESYSLKMVEGVNAIYNHESNDKREYR